MLDLSDFNLLIIQYSYKYYMNNQTDLRLIMNKNKLTYTYIYFEGLNQVMCTQFKLNAISCLLKFGLYYHVPTIHKTGIELITINYTQSPTDWSIL